MQIIELLKDIENAKIKDGSIFEVMGDFFYKLIVVDKNLYTVNEVTKKLELLDSKYIGRFDNEQYEIIELTNSNEEEKKIPEKLNKDKYIGTDLSVEDDMFNKINEIIDYLKGKRE